MHIIARAFYIFLITAMLVGCGGGAKWKSEPAPTVTSMPAALQYGGFSAGMYGTSGAHKIAVLLPTSGKNAPVGESIRNGIEIAAMQFAPNELELDFYDTANGIMAINSALASNPEIIIGPLFAENAKILRDTKSSDIPALSFTSDISAVGNGVFSISVLPANTVEAIIKQMHTHGTIGFIVFAPNNTSGQTMAGAARAISEIYNINNVGIFYYNENDTDSIKSAAMAATMYTARNAANTRAKEILAAILNHEEITQDERYSISNQLENINRTDTLGTLPYDSVLFLGSSDDTKSIASFLRYYGLGVRDAAFYGTPMWQDTNIKSDITMTGAEFVTTPNISDEFNTIYENATGKSAQRMAAIGYDAAILAFGALYSSNDMAAYLMSPAGYIGTNGMFRLRSNGANERALDTVRINGDGTTSIIKNAETNFITPIYATNMSYIQPANEIPLLGSGINPMNYINIPERFHSKYHAKTYGANESLTNQTTNEFPSVTVTTDTENPVSITSPDYKPVPLEVVGRTYIDSIEVSE